MRTHSTRGSLAHLTRLMVAGALLWHAAVNPTAQGQGAETLKMRPYGILAGCSEDPARFVTIDDPRVYTRWWKMAFGIRRSNAPNYELLESACFEAIAVSILASPQG